jgi:hypothetical protein
MGAHFTIATRFDVAIRKLQRSKHVHVRRYDRPFLYDHWEISSQDGAFFTHAGRNSSLVETLSNEQRQTDPNATVYLHKCGGLPREGARWFLEMIGDIVGTPVLTEYNEPVSNRNAWSVTYTLDINDADYWAEVRLLRRRISYGGRKGRAANLRLRKMVHSNRDDEGKANG